MPDVHNTARAMDRTPADDRCDARGPRVLCEVADLTAFGDAHAEAVWRLVESDRQLDAVVVHLAARQRAQAPADPDLDSLLLILTGDGTVHTEVGTQRIAEGTMMWLPHGCASSLTAGVTGLSYLTVHRRRAPLPTGARRAAPSPRRGYATPPPGTAGPREWARWLC